MTRDAQQLAKEYDFNYFYEFFNYIIESHTNGQKKQAKELFLELDRESRLYFVIEWLPREDQKALQLFFAKLDDNVYLLEDMID